MKASYSQLQGRRQRQQVLDVGNSKCFLLCVSLDRYNDRSSAAVRSLPDVIEGSGFDFEKKTLFCGWRLKVPKLTGTSMYS